MILSIIYFIDVLYIVDLLDCFNLRMGFMHFNMMQNNFFMVMWYLFIFFLGVHCDIFQLEQEMESIQCYDIELPELSEYLNYYRVGSKYNGIDVASTYGMTLTTVSDTSSGEDTHYLIGKKIRTTTIVLQAQQYNLIISC